MGLMEKIKEIEAEMSRTQKNKATNYHLGTLKAKLARLRQARQGLICFVLFVPQPSCKIFCPSGVVVLQICIL